MTNSSMLAANEKSIKRRKEVRVGDEETGELHWGSSFQIKKQVEEKLSFTQPFKHHYWIGGQDRKSTIG